MLLVGEEYLSMMKVKDDPSENVLNQFVLQTDKCDMGGCAGIFWIMINHLLQSYMFDTYLKLMEIGENGNLGKTVLYNAEKVENVSGDGIV